MIGYFKYPKLNFYPSTPQKTTTQTQRRFQDEQFRGTTQDSPNSFSRSSLPAASHHLLWGRKSPGFEFSKTMVSLSWIYRNLNAQDSSHTFESVLVGDSLNNLLEIILVGDEESASWLGYIQGFLFQG